MVSVPGGKRLSTVISSAGLSDPDCITSLCVELSTSVGVLLERDEEWLCLLSHNLRLRKRKTPKAQTHKTGPIAVHKTQVSELPEPPFALAEPRCVCIPGVGVAVPVAVVFVAVLVGVTVGVLDGVARAEGDAVGFVGFVPPVVGIAGFVKGKPAPPPA